MTRIKHCGKNAGCAFWLPMLCASRHPRKYFSCPARFRRYIWGLNRPVQRVFPGSNPLFSGRGERPRPGVSGVLKACLPQTEILAASQKHRKPPISGVFKLTKAANSDMCLPLNGKGNSDSATTKSNRGNTGFIWRKPAFPNSDEIFLKEMPEFTVLIMEESSLHLRKPPQ
jgi:hypothetical protein